MMNIFEEDDNYDLNQFQPGVKVQAKKNQLYENAEVWEILGVFTVVANHLRNSHDVPIIQFILSEKQKQLRDRMIPKEKNDSYYGSLCIKFLEVVVSPFELYYNEHI